jgi:hypothetical protein
MTEEWFMLRLLYCLLLLFKVWQMSGSCYCCIFLPLLFNVWQRSGSCCCCYIVYHYCLRIDRWVIHLVGLTEGRYMPLLLLYCLPLLFYIWQRSGSCCWCYIVYHCRFRSDRRMVHVVVILSTTTVLGLTEGRFM